MAAPEKQPAWPLTIEVGGLLVDDGPDHVALAGIVQVLGVRESERRQQAEQDRLRAHTDACLTRRAFDYEYRHAWDRRHPGGVDKCPCDGCRAWRREPPR